MMQFYDDQEFLSFDERKRLIDLRLSEMVTLGYQKSSRIKGICDELKLSSSTIKTVNDFERFPVLSRSKLIELESLEPPFGGFQNTDEEIDRIFTSPGPVYEPHLSENDPLWARAYVAAGIRKGDVVLNAFSYHMVAAGLTFHGGLRRIGATVIPSGTSSSQIQVQLIRDLGVTAFTGTPSFFMSIIKKAEEMGYDFKKDFRLRCACFAAEPLEPSLREIFERRYAVDTYQMYGATEVGDIAFECNEKKGWHICEEVFVEIVDPITGKRVSPGNFGEVVVTRFNNIFFLFRFGTGDLSRLIESPCPCGRTSYRLDGIVGRIGDAVKVRGLFITPNQLKKITGKFQNMKFQALISRSAHEDILTLKVEPTQSQGDYHSLEMEIRDYFKDVCTVKIDKLLFVEQGTIKEDEPLI
ncbi:MAG: AMP-binding protein, partial [Deltaproteobacteria bacterium]|nr:AMP-binding protein [Deltaproteobacteria bacterium]